MMLIGTSICGLSVGMNSTFIGLYNKEVSPKTIKGMTGGLLQYILGIGILLTGIFGLYVPSVH